MGDRYGLFVAKGIWPEGTQNLYSVDYLFFYASDGNIFFVLIQPTPESSDTPEADMPYEEVVYTMGDYMLDEMEWKKW